MRFFVYSLKNESLHDGRNCMSSLANKNTLSGKNITSEWFSATGTFIGIKVFHKQWRS